MSSLPNMGILGNSGEWLGEFIKLQEEIRSNSNSRIGGELYDRLATALLIGETLASFALDVHTAKTITFDAREYTDRQLSSAPVRDLQP